MADPTAMRVSGCGDRLALAELCWRKARAPVQLNNTHTPTTLRVSIQGDIYTTPSMSRCHLCWCKPGGTRVGKKEGPTQRVEQGRKERIRKNRSGLEGASGVQAARMDRNIKWKKQGRCK